MIYCVEDDEEIRNLIIYTLKISNFEAKGFSKGKEFWQEIKENKPALILLDIMLPEEDGISILKKLKANNEYKDIPVVITTAKGTEFDKIMGLDLGADDYLVKPFGMMEMIARIKAVLRRSPEQIKDEMLTNGKILVDTNRHSVLSSGKPILLTLKEYELLIFLLKNKEKVFTRDQLLINVWGIEFEGESRTVDVHIGTLRTKLMENGELIETVRGVGYKMVDANEKKDI